jgi:CBS domain-containing protein
MLPVREHMVSPVRTVRDTRTVVEVERELEKLGISALPVEDQAGGMVGVISRTDLLRAGRVRITSGRRRARALTLPHASARELMTAKVEVLLPEKSLAEAARRMVREHLHRLYVSEDRRPEGVVGTKEMMRAVAEARLALPISKMMHEALVVVNAGDPMSLAIDRMVLAHHSALVVVEDGWPVGVLTQADALAARDAPRDDRVDHWMDPRLICLPLAMPAFRAAEQAVATRARCVLAVDGKGACGILTGMDFTRLVMG